MLFVQSKRIPFGEDLIDEDLRVEIKFFLQQMQFFKQETYTIIDLLNKRVIAFDLFKWLKKK